MFLYVFKSVPMRTLALLTWGGGLAFLVDSCIFPGAEGGLHSKCVDGLSE